MKLRKEGNVWSTMEYFKPKNQNQHGKHLYTFILREEEERKVSDKLSENFSPLLLPFDTLCITDARKADSR